MTECVTLIMVLHRAGAAGYDHNYNIVQYQVTECKCDLLRKDNDGIASLHAASLSQLDLIHYLRV